LFLGDSMTFGLGVGDADTFPALVEAIVRGRGARQTTVANCGVPGYNLSQLVRAAELRLSDTKPRLLMVVVHSSDLETAVDFSALTPKSAATQFAITHSRLLRFGYIMTRTWGMAREMEQSGKYLSAASINEYLRRLATAARENNSQVVVVQLPDIHHPALSFDEALAAHNLATYKLRPLPRDDRHFLADREHWTVTGQRIVADQVAPVVEAALATGAAQRSVSDRVPLQGPS